MSIHLTRPAETPLELSIIPSSFITKPALLSEIFFAIVIAISPKKYYGCKSR
jgi:hypothetical protein